MTERFAVKLLAKFAHVQLLQLLDLQDDLVSFHSESERRICGI